MSITFESIYFNFRLVDKLREEGMNDPELLFNMARRIVIAEIQAITYRQWLPLVVGQEIMKKVICQKKKQLFVQFHSVDLCTEYCL